MVHRNPVFRSILPQSNTGKGGGGGGGALLPTSVGCSDPTWETHVEVVCIKHTLGKRAADSYTNKQLLTVTFASIRKMLGEAGGR